MLIGRDYNGIFPFDRKRIFPLAMDYRPVPENHPPYRNAVGVVHLTLLPELERPKSGRARSSRFDKVRFLFGRTRAGVG
jgi:hypothetical protein